MLLRIICTRDSRELLCMHFLQQRVSTNVSSVFSSGTLRTSSRLQRFRNQVCRIDYTCSCGSSFAPEALLDLCCSATKLDSSAVDSGYLVTSGQCRASWCPVSLRIAVAFGACVGQQVIPRVSKVFSILENRALLSASYSFLPSCRKFSRVVCRTGIHF